MSEWIYVAVMGVMLICSLVKNYFQEALIKLYEKRLKEAYGNYDIVNKYCLTHILKEALEVEDYETADQCKKILKKLNPIN